MIGLRISRSAAFGVIVLLVSCAKSERAPDPTTATKDDMAGMPGMPGMAPSNTKSDSASAAGTSVTFTAAQIQHGGVKWGTVVMGACAGAPE